MALLTLRVSVFYLPPDGDIVAVLGVVVEGLARGGVWQRQAENQQQGKGLGKPEENDLNVG